MIFLDSNVLVYASGIHGEDDPRTHIAREIVIANRPYAISIQVLHEFYDRVVRPAKSRQLTDAEAVRFVTLWRHFQVVPLTLDLFDHAVAIRARYKFRYYDSAILAAALQIGCTTVLTEDMQDGQTIDGLQIVNPFPKV